MSENSHRNPLPHLFIGDWTLLRHEPQDSRVKNETSTEHRTISIEPIEGKDGCPNGRHYRLCRPNEEAEATCSHYLLLNGDRNDLVNCDKCSEVGVDHLYISFWRHSSYDCIFAVRQFLGSAPHEIWSARRSPEPVAHSGTDKIIGKEWKVELSGGPRAAHGKVIIRKIGPIKGKEKSALEADLGLYGLFHVKVDKDKGVELLYDILDFDEGVRSLNSIFGVRSLSWGERHVLATFNNKSSLPASHIPSDTQQEHRLGQPMPFEVKVKSSDPDEPDPDDPDVGVWVGVEGP